MKKKNFLLLSIAALLFSGAAISLIANDTEYESYDRCISASNTAPRFNGRCIGSIFHAYCETYPNGDWDYDQKDPNNWDDKLSDHEWEPATLDCYSGPIDWEQYPAYRSISTSKKAPKTKK